MRLHLAIPRQVAEDLKIFCQLEGARLKEVASAAEQVGVVVEIEAFERAIEKIVGAPFSRKTSRALLTLASVRRTHDADPEDLLEAVTRNLEERREVFGWTKEDIDKWRSLHTDLTRLLRLDSVNVLEKSLELSYAFPNLYRRARVLTDIRPVFAENGDNIRAAVITHTLEISFTSDGESKAIRLAVDSFDLGQLEAACQRARTKATAAKSFLDVNGQIPAIVAGDHGDEDA